ncbi:MULTISPECIES: cysteine desulfurase family protein [unclassified Arcicella]|uniref:cysteine desulfurase family protein n=1 Tax=unclassified Arcicella TaxID=2644986 RepID=UPI002857543E|nr:MULTISPECIES: cysteine desulfurase family protein [unclassified Arcicella]MDR6560873.1 cysteine desulfurase [Arcicella sp. BE51]MDR6810757.1 cysteine desulfurase [Arcicella sp. BE140]MDR6822107.1 cysteine desulfurase [Arcicella sp. BE139]
MNRIYLDNAATTPMDKAVIEAMLPMMESNFGNPSSIHTHGREVRNTIERARKTIAGLLNTSPAEIFFTSGGTEADNTAIVRSIEDFGITHAITSPLEHHAVLHTLEYMAKKGKIKLSYVELDAKGHVDLKHLEELLRDNPKTLVSLMHGNNEIGNLLDLTVVGQLCEDYGAIFHSDTVQTMGHYRHDLQQMKIDFMVGAAHKFHGPKGVGFLYINAKSKITPFIHGGSQERNMRGGTENVYGIVGLAKALEIAYAGMDEHRKHIETLKARMIARLSSELDDIEFNGDSDNLDRSLYTVLNVSFPPSEEADMFLFNLDINKISASGGSACTSGSDIGSHVLTALNVSAERPSVRFSFSKYNTIEEIDYVVDKLVSMLKVTA